jgi:putative ABC transport system permease protein
MFKNYLKIAWRNLSKQKFYSSINILGLAVGLAGAILTFLFVQHELSYDRFQKNRENLFRIYTNFHAEDGSIERTFRGVVMPMGPVLEESFPEIVRSTRLLHDNITVEKDGNLSSERILMVEKNFFEVFTFPLVQGQTSSVFSNENSIILSENHARKYFGDTDPLGQSLSLINGQNKGEFVVSGVAEQPPANSSIPFEMVIDIDSANRLNLNEMWENNWGAFGWQNYLLLDSSGSVESLLSKLSGFNQSHFSEYIERTRSRRGWKGEESPISFGLQPITRVHLDPLVSGSLNLKAIFILSGIAAIVLLIACINFTNLAIARASTRSLEVGVRKVLGSNTQQLIRQFWGEFLAITGISLIAGLVLAEILLPVFNRLSDRNMSLKEVFQPLNLIILLGLFVLVSIASASYPALFMSRFKPVEIFRSKLRIGGKNTLTKVLVTLQFALSVFLMISTIVMGRQIHFMLTADPGFNKEGVMIIRAQEPDADSGNTLLKRFRDRLSQETDVLSVSGTGYVIGQVATYPFRKEGREIDVFQNRVDYDYFKTMGIEVTRGREFSPEYPSDVNGVIVNEKLLNDLEIQDPIGKTLLGYSRPLQIIGVVEDYINQDFRESILPAIHIMNPNWGIRHILVRFSPGSVSEMIAKMERTWKEIQPDKPFLYSFLDDSFRQLYDEERRWATIVTYSSALAVVIACLGIFGLTSLTVNRKTKEIGIRKVLGANVPQIVNTLTKEFLILVGIANIFGWPIAYIAMQELLNNYYHRIALGAAHFLLAGVLSFSVALITTVFLAVRAATANPVDSLRYE